MSRAGKGRSKEFPNGYFEESELPLTSLIFLLPFMIAFEIGTHFYPSDPIAFQKMQMVFHRLGADGRFIPALALVFVMVAWHIAKKDRWRVQWATLLCMGFESALVAMPLLGLGIAFARWQVSVPLAAPVGPWAEDAVLYLGAGIYEELVFRLILMTVLTVIFADWLRMPDNRTYLLMVLTSAVLFSLYHYLGHETFRLRSFVFRSLAGIYFAVLFLTRGFGITAGAHIAYDVIILGLTAYAGH